MVDKQCTKCRTTKPLTDFYKNRTQPDGHEGWCKDCKKVWRKARYHERDWFYWTEKTFGVTKEDWMQMMALQGEVCAICKEPEKTRRLSIDHCHSTGKVRGLLCNRCNKAIGIFEDKVELLEEAIKYLNKEKEIS